MNKQQCAGDALSMTVSEWSQWLFEKNQQHYRAGQIFSWLHKGVDFNKMTNLPAALRDELYDCFGNLQRKG